MSADLLSRLHTTLDKASALSCARIHVHDYGCQSWVQAVKKLSYGAFSGVCATAHDCTNAQTPECPTARPRTARGQAQASPPRLAPPRPAPPRTNAPHARCAPTHNSRARHTDARAVTSAGAPSSTHWHYSRLQGRSLGPCRAQSPHPLIACGS